MSKSGTPVARAAAMMAPVLVPTIRSKAAPISSASIFLRRKRRRDPIEIGGRVRAAHATTIQAENA